MALVKHPAARIADKFPAGPCILEFPGFMNRHMGRAEMGMDRVLVVEVTDMRPVQQVLKAIVWHNGEQRELVRNLAGESNPNTPVDPFTLEVLDRATMYHLPSTSYVHDVVVNVVNDVKDGLVDRSAKALTEVGTVSARLNGLKEHVDGLPNTAAFNALRAEVLAIKVVADAAELSARAVVASAEEALKAQARQLDERMAGVSASNAALERKVATLSGVVQRMLEANENVKQLDEIAEQKAAEAASQALLSLDDYRARLQGMNFAQLRSELKRFGITIKSGETESLRLQAENEYARQLQIQAAKASPAA